MDASVRILRSGRASLYCSGRGHFQNGISFIRGICLRGRSDLDNHICMAWLRVRRPVVRRTEGGRKAFDSLCLGYPCPSCALLDSMVREKACRQRRISLILDSQFAIQDSRHFHRLDSGIENLKSIDGPG